MPARVDQRPARVAGVERGVGLHHVVDQAPAGAAQRAAEGADDARRHRALEAVWVADGDRQLADADAPRIAEAHRRAGSPCTRTTARSVPGSSPISTACRLAAVRQGDADLGGAVDDVAVGDDEAVGRDDEARAAAGGIAAAVRVTDLDVDDRRADGFGRADDGARVGIEQLAVVAVGGGAAARATPS